MTAPDASAWYVYAVLPAPAPAPPACDPILPGAGMTVIPAGMPGVTVAALASLVPRAVFGGRGAGGDEAACGAADPVWVAGCAARHHAVIEAARRRAACLPLGFGTLFGSEAAVRAWLVRDAAAFTHALDLLGHDEEWAVTLSEDRAAHEAWISAHDPALRAAEAEAAAASAGRRFLLARSIARGREAACAAHGNACVARLAETLAAHCRLIRAEAPPDGALAAWSLLAEAGGTVSVAVARHEAALAETGLHLRVTGPWPPYAFARAALETCGHA